MDMKRLRLANKVLGLGALCIITTVVHAGIPLWSFSPNGSPQVTVSATGTATVIYTVTNNSKKPHQLMLSSKTPSGISQSGGPCVLEGKSLTNPNPTCTLTLSINGSALPANTVSGGPFLCQANANNTPNPNQCYQPSPGDDLVITRTAAPGTTTLSTSIAPPSILALSVNNPPSLTGNARYITIQNTGTVQATGLLVSATGLPAGSDITTVPTTCTGTLAPNDTCRVTITPGSNPTSACNTGIAPTSGTITVSAANVGTPVTSDVVVLSYGCQYQEGFLYSVDDTTADTGSIGGKVLALTDQRPRLPGGIVWDADPDCTNPPRICTHQTNAWDFYYGENLATVLGSTNPNNTGTNGPGDTYQIFSVLNGNNGNTNNPANYAAAVCTTYTAGGYADWYLPALCEMGPNSNGSGCRAGTPNIVDNLGLLLSDPNNSPDTSCSYGTNCLGGLYWSSTEYSPIPLQFAWLEQFDSGGSISQVLAKFQAAGVRCSRALTI
jgi:hypothetical protein